MSIYLGTATINEFADTFTLTPPLGFDSVDAVRLSNYSPYVIILENIDGINQSVEYLMPLQQMVYRTQNISRIPVGRVLQEGATFDTEQVFVEWSTHSDEDFIGQYPVPLSGLDFAIPNAQSQDGVVVLADSASGEIDPTNRDPAVPYPSITFWNQGPGTVYFSANPTTVLGPTTSASLTSGQGAQVNAAIVYLKADASGASVSWIS